MRNIEARVYQSGEEGGYNLPWSSSISVEAGWRVSLSSELNFRKYYHYFVIKPARKAWSCNQCTSGYSTQAPYLSCLLTHLHIFPHCWGPMWLVLWVAWRHWDESLMERGTRKPPQEWGRACQDCRCCRRSMRSGPWPGSRSYRMCWWGRGRRKMSDNGELWAIRSFYGEIKSNTCNPTLPQYFSSGFWKWQAW